MIIQKNYEQLIIEYIKEQKNKILRDPSGKLKYKFIVKCYFSGSIRLCIYFLHELITLGNTKGGWCKP